MILCAEDDPLIRAVLKNALKSAGFEVLLAKDGVEAVELARQQPTQLIILDVMMPRMDGFEAMRRIRELASHKQTPILFLTAASQQEAQLKAYKLGAAEYMTKPFMPSVLVAKVRVLLARVQKQTRRRMLLDGAPETVLEAADDPANMIGKYIKMEEIGRGASGVVHRAWDGRLRRWAALKLMSQRATEATEEAARQQARLRHPNIGRIFDVLTGEDGTVIAAQFVDGQTLAARLGGRPETRHTDAARLVRLAAMALQHTHNEGLFHLAIKPSNILVSRRDDIPLVVDFGMTPGPGYAAPEQGQGGMIEPLADVYGLGATLFRGLTGQEPGSSGAFGDTPRRIKAIVERALSEDPLERHASPGELAADLQAFLEAPRTRPLPAPAADRARILCVDDEVGSRELIRDVVESAGYECILAASGRRALELASSSHLDMVILDLNMPQVSGFDVLLRLRQMRQHAETPVLIVSADDTEEARLSAYDYGASDYCLKPFDISILLAKVDLLLRAAAPAPAAPALILEGAPPEVRDAAASPSCIVEKYVLVRELGDGGMSQVYLGWDSGLRTWVAMKTPRRFNADDFERLYSEGLEVARLDHPNLCRVYDVFEQAGRPYIVMQFIDGASVTGQLPPEQAAKLTLQIARAVQHAHEHGVLHRDIKPSNVLIDHSTGNPFLIDFGLVKPIEDMPRAGRRSPSQRIRRPKGEAEREVTPPRLAIGTPGYIAPEHVAENLGLVTAASDVYSLGATLYCWLSGRPPFEPTEDGYYDRLFGEAPPPPSGGSEIPEELEQICLTAIATLPLDRYGSAREMADALEAYLRSLGIAT